VFKFRAFSGSQYVCEFSCFKRVVNIYCYCSCNLGILKQYHNHSYAHELKCHSTSSCSTIDASLYKLFLHYVFIFLFCIYSFYLLTISAHLIVVSPDAIRRIVKEEGFLALYRGIGPALLLVCIFWGCLHAAN
jgi:hypothetical protein